MIGPDDDEEEYYTANIEWLATADPDDWHRVADEFNWSEPLYVLDWIVRRPNCDIATALYIFWKGEPTSWLFETGADDEAPNGYSFLNKEICAYVADRVRAGGYSRSEIEFIPNTWNRKDYLDLVAQEEALENPTFRTHSDLILCRSGRGVCADWAFSQRYPERFHHSNYGAPVYGEAEYQPFKPPVLTEASEGYERVEYETFQALPEWLQQMPEGQAGPVEPKPEPEIDAEGDDSPPMDGPEIAPVVEVPVEPAVVEPVANEAPADEPTSFESAPPTGSSEDASSRVRALRRATAPESEAAPKTKPSSGGGGWWKRLFGR